MHFRQAILLFFAAVIAGTLNAVAGGGSFVSFPVLLFTGVPPVPANATNTVALWPGLAASALAYFKRLNAPAKLTRAIEDSDANTRVAKSFGPKRFDAGDGGTSGNIPGCGRVVMHKHTAQKV